MLREQMLDCRCRPAKPCCCWVKKSIKRQKLTINVDPRGQTITILSKPSSMYKTNTPIVQKVCPNVFGTILVANPPRVIQPGSDESKKSSKQKKSLISMLKKLDVKLLNVLDKNKNLLKDSEVKQLSQEKPITEECTLQPKGLASRRYKKSRRQLSLGSFSRKSIAQSSKEKTPSKTSCSIVQLDLTQVSSRLRPKQYLAQSNYNSTFVLPNCEREQHQMEKKLPVKRSNLSATLNNLKRIGRSETMKKIAVGSGSPLSINRGSQKDFQKCGKSMQEQNKEYKTSQRRCRDVSDLRTSSDSLCQMISEKSDVSAFSRVPKDPLKSNLYIPANKRMKKPLKKQRPDIPIDFERERTAHFVDSARTREDKRETEVTEKIEFGCADRNSADSRFNYLKNEINCVLRQMDEYNRTLRSKTVSQCQVNQVFLN